MDDVVAELAKNPLEKVAPRPSHHRGTSPQRPMLTVRVPNGRGPVP